MGSATGFYFLGPFETHRREEGIHGQERNFKITEEAGVGSGFLRASPEQTNRSGKKQPGSPPSAG